MLAHRSRAVALAGVSAVALVSAFAVVPSSDAVTGRTFEYVASASQDSPVDTTSRAGGGIKEAFFWLFDQRYTQPRPAEPVPQVRERPRQRWGDSYDNDRLYRTRKASQQQVHANSLKARTIANLRNPPPAQPSDGPLLLTVSVAKQTVTLYDGGKLVAKGPVSTGTRDFPTPMGVFSVLEKNWWHRSNLYSAAPMPYMQRITWSGVALHAGELPGYAASHGCVRLSESFALRMWYTTKIGARVVIAWDELAPLDITHPHLFQPKPGQPETDTPTPDKAPSPPPPDVGAVSMADPNALPSQDNPRDLAPQAMAVAHATDEARADLAVLRPRRPSELFIIERLLNPDSDPLRSEIDGEPPVMLASLNGGTASGLRPALSDAFAVARRATPRNQQTSLVAQPDVAPVLRPGPVSIFVSRKDRRLYVRKGFEPLFDTPVNIVRPEQPLGTHVFTAVSLNNDGAMHWTVVSPTTGPRDEIALHDGFGRKSARSVVPSKVMSTAAASAALDRIEIPPEAADRISELVSVGATLIIGDVGLSRASAALLDSDFTIVTR